MIYGLFFVPLGPQRPPLAGEGSTEPGAKAQAAAAVQAEPKTYTYRIAATYPHSTGAYTQGLQYVDGTMWEGTGQHGESVVRKTDLATGKTEVMVRLPRSEFGEGITLLGGKLYQLTARPRSTRSIPRRSAAKSA